MVLVIWGLKWNYTNPIIHIYHCSMPTTHVYFKWACSFIYLAQIYIWHAYVDIWTLICSFNMYFTSIFIWHLNVKNDNNVHSTFGNLFNMLKCWFVDVNVEWTNCESTCLCHLHMWMSNAQIVHSTWIFFHVLSTCVHEMLNALVEWTPFLYLCLRIKCFMYFLNIDT
jgi:hypothetical protein